MLSKQVKTDWANLFKVRIGNYNKAFEKHEVVKLLIVMKLKQKYSKRRSTIRIYTEMELSNGKKCDVYFEDLKTKEVICYEIQKEYTQKWLDAQKEAYSDFEVPFMKSTDWIPIPLESLSDDVVLLSKELEEYIF